MSLISEVHWYEDEEPPKVCAWCGDALEEGEVFVFEVESEAIRSGEVTLVEHDSLEGFAGLHAACEDCRTGIIRNAEEIEAEFLKDGLDNATTRKSVVRMLFIGALYCVWLAIRDFDAFWFVFIEAVKICGAGATIFFLIRSVVNYFQSKFNL
jgi:predicted nucleic acid-binding Zn ribbon protein